MNREHTMLPDPIQERLTHMSRYRPVPEIARMTGAHPKEIHRALSEQSIRVESARLITQRLTPAIITT